MNEKKVVIAKVNLSGVSSAKVEKDVNGINGQVNVSEDGRKYVIIHLEERSDPFKFTKRTMMYSTNDNGTWPAFTPAKLAEQLAKAEAKGEELTVSGEAITAVVEPYTIGENKVSTYSTIVLAKENVDTVFTRAGHPRINTETGQLLVPAKAEEKPVDVDI